LNLHHAAFPLPYLAFNAKKFLSVCGSGVTNPASICCTVLRLIPRISASRFCVKRYSLRNSTHSVLRRALRSLSSSVGFGLAIAFCLHVEPLRLCSPRAFSRYNMRLKVTCSALSVNANIYPALYLRFHFFYIFWPKNFLDRLSALTLRRVPHVPKI